MGCGRCHASGEVARDDRENHAGKSTAVGEKETGGGTLLPPELVPKKGQLHFQTVAENYKYAEKKNSGKMGNIVS